MIERKSGSIGLASNNWTPIGNPSEMNRIGNRLARAPSSKFCQLANKADQFADNCESGQSGDLIGNQPDWPDFFGLGWQLVGRPNIFFCNSIW